MSVLRLQDGTAPASAGGVSFFVVLPCARFQDPGGVLDGPGWVFVWVKWERPRKGAFVCFFIVY